MSAFASFSLLTKRDFEGFCKIGRLSRVDWNDPAKFMVVPVKRTHRPSDEERLEQAYFQGLWNYLEKHAKKPPFTFHWSGWMLVDLMTLLKEQRNIDLNDYTLRTNSRSISEWQVFDRSTKDKYYSKLDPSLFSESEMKAWYVQHDKNREEKGLMWMEKTMSKKEFAAMKVNLKKHLTDYSDTGRALMDGVKVLHEALKLVDDNHVILLHIG